MDYKNLIVRYFEGELDTTEKDLLFSELARNPLLREEFEYEMKLITIAQQDYARIEPPTESMNYIFGAFGYKIPNSLAGKFASPSVLSFDKFRMFLGKSIPYFAISLLTSAITLFLFWYFFFPSGGSTQKGNEVPKIQSTSEISSSLIPDQQSNATQNINYAYLERLLQKAFERALNNIQSQNSNRSFASDQIDVPLMENHLANRIPVRTSNQVANNGFIHRTPEKTINIVPPNISTSILTASGDNFPSFSDYLKNFSVSVRGFSLNSDQSSKVNLEQSGILSNAGIGIGYNLGKYSTIGIEFGQEKFPQNFELNLYGELTYYRQNPLLWWYGISYRQMIPFFFRSETINPFLQAFLGSTTIGPLLRGMIGLQYEPDKRVSLFLGWEANALYYNVQHKIYKTTKNGLTYGVNIRF